MVAMFRLPLHGPGAHGLLSFPTMRFEELQKISEMGDRREGRRPKRCGVSENGMGGAR